MDDDDLLELGLAKLDDALTFFMEIETPYGEALAHFVHAAITFAERTQSPTLDS